MSDPRSDRVARYILTLLTAILPLSIAFAEPARSGAGGASVAGGSRRMVGIIVKLDDDPVTSYRGTQPGLAATSARETGKARLDPSASAVRDYRAHVGRKHTAFEVASRAAIPTARVTHRYDIVLGGVAMQVPEDEISRVAQLPGVKAVYRDRRLPLHTDTSPRFIGAGTVWAKLQGAERAGEGVIVGILDTGIWPEHPSFSDPDPSGKLYPPPPISPTSCEFSGGANPGAAFTCNNKLIGAYRFLAGYEACAAAGSCSLEGDFTSARDSEGHGTHIASTAAGNAAVAAEVLGIDRKDVSGVAPRAHVIAYKVCGPDTCFASDSIAGIQQAILDGVNVLNFSVGGGTDPYSDPLELAFLDAYAAGVFVAASAGNEGPAADTMNHRGPWVTTVAASTERRAFLTTVTVVGADQARLRLAGASITAGLRPAAPVVVAAGVGDEFCDQTSPADTFIGMIVVCARGGTTTRQAKSFNVAQRGAVGMILHNTNDGEDLLTDSHSIPSVQITKSDGDALLGFLAVHPSATASFQAGQAREAPGDVITAFSSRGGTGVVLGVLKPDVTAPGIQILAGTTPEPRNPVDPPGQLFQAIAGTSMSSPHVAGAAALLKDLHPEWSPGQLKSAIMTTASRRHLVQEDGETPFTPFDAGSGRVELQDAQSPGLTFDVPASDYADHAGDLWTVNQPSIYIPDTAPNVLTVPRTPRSLLPHGSTWQLTVVPDAALGLAIVVPPILAVPGGASASFDIQIDKSGIPAGEARHASLELRNGSLRLHLPISAAGHVARPDLIVTELELGATTATRGSPLFSSVTIQNVGTATANGFYFQVYLSREDDLLSVADEFWWFCDIDSLAPGDTTFCANSFDIPAGIAAGTYFVLVRVDDGLTVGESDETNNIVSEGPITIN